MSKLLNHPQVRPLLSDEHFSVGRNIDRGLGFAEELSASRTVQAMLTMENDTHASTTDPDSRLYRKGAGREAKLSCMGHATMENRRG